MAVGHYICSHQLLDKVSQRTVMLISCLQTQQYIIIGFLPLCRSPLCNTSYLVSLGLWLHMAILYFMVNIYLQVRTFLFFFNTHIFIFVLFFLYCFLGFCGFLFCFVLFFVFRDRVSLYSPGCAGTHSVDQASFKLRNQPPECWN